LQRNILYFGNEQSLRILYLLSEVFVKTKVLQIMKKSNSYSEMRDQKMPHYFFPHQEAGPLGKSFVDGRLSSVQNVRLS